MSVLGFSLAQQLKASRGLYKMLKPLADRYANLAGYRQHGMKYDDLLIEENPTVQKALGRLTERESYDRAYRHRLAHMAAIAHAPLPEHQHLPKDQDVRYLKPIVAEIEKEQSERDDWDSVKLDRSTKH